MISSDFRIITSNNEYNEFIMTPDQIINRKGYLVFKHEDFVRFFVINNLAERSACFYIANIPHPLGRGC